MQKASLADSFVTLEQFMAMFSLNERQAKTYMKQIGIIKVGQGRVVTREAFDRWIADRTEATYYTKPLPKIERRKYA